MTTLPRPHLTSTFLLIVAFVSATLATVDSSGDDKHAESTVSADEITQDTKTPEPQKTLPSEIDFWKALKLLNSKIPKDLEEGRRLLTRSSNAEFSHAQVALANCYLSGSSGFERNLKKAATLYRLAAERGNGYAMVTYAQCLINGTGVWKNEATAKVWLIKATSDESAFKTAMPPEEFRESEMSRTSTVTGSIELDQAKHTLATANALLGDLLTDEKDKVGAHACYVKAAEAGGTLSGIYGASIRAAMDFAFGQGAAQDMVKANKMLELSKQLTKRASIQMVHNYVSMKLEDEFAMGDLEEETTKNLDEAESEMQMMIAKQFLNKKDPHYNPSEAEKWYKLGAESGTEWSRMELALFYARGELGKPDFASAYTWFEKVGDRHAMAIANRGIMLANGLGVPKDPARAAALFAKPKYDSIVCYLGRIGKCPTEVITYDAMVRLNETWAKDHEDATAQYLLGERYERGWGYKVDQNRAMKWYKKAAKQNHKEAMRAYALSLLEVDGRASRSIEEAVGFLKKAADLGDSQACFKLAYFNMEGSYGLSDPAEAEKLYIKTLELDPSADYAANNLGSYYEGLAHQKENTRYEATGIPDFKKAVSFYEKGPEGGYNNYNLGNIYYTNGHTFPESWVTKDDTKAYGYFLKAAEKGHTAARKILGDMHLYGYGVPKTPAEAAYHYRLAALDGNVDALKVLCRLYTTGTGVRLDYDRALFWVYRLAESDRIYAAQMACDMELHNGNYKGLREILGFLEQFDNRALNGFTAYRYYRMYQEGLGVKKNPAKAQKLLKKAASFNNGDALAVVAGDLLKNGDRKAAIEKLKAASESSAMACTMLADLAIGDKGNPANQKAALKLYSKAAEVGDSDALYALALARLNDLPGAPSVEEALQYAEQAENLGHPKAADLRKQIEEKRDKSPESEKAI